MLERYGPCVLGATVMTRDVSRRGAMWCDVREFSGGVRVTWYEVMTELANPEVSDIDLLHPPMVLWVVDCCYGRLVVHIEDEGSGAVDVEMKFCYDRLPRLPPKSSLPVM